MDDASLRVSDAVRDRAVVSLRQRVFSLFGTVDVWRVPPDMQGGYGDIFRQLKQRQRQLPG